MVRLDHMMEDALRLNVKWSLLELSKAINGDGKTTPNPLFRVLVILQNSVQGGVAQVWTTVPLKPQTYHNSFISSLNP
jgi:dynein heavy chain